MGKRNVRVKTSEETEKFSGMKDTLPISLAQPRTSLLLEVY